MKKHFLFIAILCLIISGTANAGMLTLGAKASIYNPPEAGASPSLMYGFMLNYDVNAILNIRAGASYTSYTANDIDYTLMPITLDFIAHFLPASNIDPYLGLGIGYYSKTVDAIEDSYTGGQAIAGVQFNINGLNAAFEATYIVPDLSQSDEGSLSWGGWMTGTSYVFIPF